MEERQIAKTHKLVINNRKTSMVTGVLDVLAFDLNEILLETEQGMLMVKGKNPEKFTQKEKWRVHFAVLGYKSVFAVLCVSWVLWAAAADYLLYRM